jgi:CBS domain-containing protein
MMLIRDVIRDREPYSMKSSASVQEALREFMDCAEMLALVCVVDEGGKLLGVFSERDVVKRVVYTKA